MEWVYIAPSDEPAVFEADAIVQPDESSKRVIDIFSSKLPVEDPVSDPDEPEYYGDEDVVEERVSPVEAFETFAGKHFPVGRDPDFSGSIYAESSNARVKPVHSEVAKRWRHLPSSETRSQRLARLSAEVAALRAEYEENEDDSGSDALTTLSSLRDQLNEIDNSISSGRLSGRKNMSVLPVINRLDESVDSGTNSGGLSLHLTSPSIPVLSTLEKRIAALESTVGVCKLEEPCDGDSLGTILEDVRVRLALIKDENLPQKLKRDAHDIARILQSDLQNEKGSEILRAATTLEKMEKWKDLAETVPLVIERLRSLKRVQEEAEQFSSTLATMGSNLDSLQQRSDANCSLAENVRNSLKTNMKAVQENLDLLNEKVATLKAGGS